MPLSLLLTVLSSLDTGTEKKELCLSLGAEKWVDFRETKDLVGDIKNTAGGDGPHAAVVSGASMSFMFLSYGHVRLTIKLLMYGAPRTRRRLAISVLAAPSSLSGSQHNPRSVRPSSGRWTKASTSLDPMLGAHTLLSGYRV